MITTARKKTIMADYGQTKNDTGSVEVQVALLSERIAALTEHLKMHVKDKLTRLGLLKLVGQRRSLLNYLKQNDPNRYATLIKKLGLRS